MDAIEQAYTIELAGAYSMPPRIHIDHQENTLLYMPCFLENIFGTKFLSLFPGNAIRNQPVINGVVMLNEAASGKPVAILDGAKVTAIRTGAVGGVAVRHTAPQQVESLGLIGAGVQGFHQVLFSCQARKIVNVSVYDMSKEKTRICCEHLSNALPQVSIKAAQSVEDLLVKSEIVITATPSQKPVLPDDKNLLRNKCYIGIGSYKPDMREFPRALFELIERVLIDTEHGLEESGDLITPLDKGWIEKSQILKFGSYLTAKIRPGSGEKTTLFKSVGMGLFDIVVSELIYYKALQKGIGQVLD
jgi:ornithine cyclodeaminase/alanine dehydrogenase-like protein (mu-crystallin family)